jgi:hypothetical protein
MITGSTTLDFAVASTCESKQENNLWSSSSGDFSVAWIADVANINFTVTAKTTGWVGFGISTQPKMTGADMYVGWVSDATSQLTLVDAHATGQVQPTPDAKNSIVNPQGSQVREFVGIFPPHCGNIFEFVEIFPPLSGNIFFRFPTPWKYFYWGKYFVHFFPNRNILCNIFLGRGCYYILIFSTPRYCRH